MIRAGIATDTPQPLEIFRLLWFFWRGVGVESPALSLGRRGTPYNKENGEWQKENGEW